MQQRNRYFLHEKYATPDWEVACAYQRAAAVMTEASKSLPRVEIEESVKALIDGDGYGMRARLAAAFLDRNK
jgi:hypothetical protein